MLSKRAVKLLLTDRVIEAAAAAECNAVCAGVADMWNSPITDKPSRLKVMRIALEAAVKEAQK